MTKSKYEGLTLLVTTMSDGSRWGVDVAEIALNRATHYAYDFGGDIQRSLSEETLPLFEDNKYSIVDWAVGNMNWEDFKEHYAIQTKDPVNYQEGWISGCKQVKKY